MSQSSKYLNQKNLEDFNIEKVNNLLNNIDNDNSNNSNKKDQNLSL